MDLKTIHQQVEANITKQQDDVFKTNLQEIRQHSSHFGNIQESMTKLKPKRDSNPGGYCQTFENGSSRDVFENIKIEDSSTSRFSPSASGSLVKCSAEVKTQTPLKLSTQNAGHRLTISSSKNLKLEPIDLRSLPRTISDSSSTEPLNLSANACKRNGFLPLELFRKNAPMLVQNDHVMKKILVPPSMRLKMLPANSNFSPHHFIPSSSLKPINNSGLIRLSQTDRNTKLSRPKDFSRFVISVTSSPSGQSAPTITPTSSDKYLRMGTVQTQWLAGRHISGLGTPPLEKLSRDSVQRPKLNQTTSCEVKSVSKLPQSKMVRSLSAPTENTCSKISFLGQVNLIPVERAEKMRGRRYGRRRAVAHPVYSGGLYVSHTASEKRVIPPELLDIGLETIPIKRPRGRPKGSTNKRNSPNKVSSGMDEEYYRILQEAKPSDVPPDHNKIDDLCEICNKPGDFLMCDTCSRLYHMSCLTPPLNEVPHGMWCCSLCETKIKDRNSACEWPGLLSVAQSFYAFNSNRERALASAREKARCLKLRKCKLTDQKKMLAAVLKEKVCHKAKIVENYKQKMQDCENLTLLLEKLRCVINRNLDES